MLPQNTTTTRDEHTLARLKQEWEGITSRLETQTRTQNAVRVQQWESRLHDLKAEQERLMREGKWVRGSSDLLSIIGRSRRETYHSRMLAWFLDPIAPHGLGDGFLRRFLRSCGLSDDHLTQRTDIRISCEVGRKDCRADIVVWTENATLIIENKIEAAEADRQCETLYKRFSDLPNACFVFLTVDGRAPISGAEEFVSEYRRVSYRELLCKLDELLDTAPPADANQPGRATVHDYQETLRKLL